MTTWAPALLKRVQTWRRKHIWSNLFPTLGVRCRRSIVELTGLSKPTWSQRSQRLVLVVTTHIKMFKNLYRKRWNWLSWDIARAYIYLHMNVYFAIHVSFIVVRLILINIFKLNFEFKDHCMRRGLLLECGSKWAGASPIGWFIATPVTMLIVDRMLWWWSVM